jgi:hypothetical protein
MIERWIVCKFRADGAPAVADYAASFDTTRPLLGSNRVLCRAEFPDDGEMLQQAQEDPRILVWPAKAVSVDRLPDAKKTWLADHGITLEPGDTTLNVLRKIRDAKTLKKPGARFSFDISERE